MIHNAKTLQLRCEHGAKYHPTQKTERRVRAFLSRLLQDPESLREHVERQVAEECRALIASEREVAARKERLASLGRRRSGYLDQQAEGLIPVAELREKLDALETERARIERELRGFEGRGRRLRELEALPGLVEAYLRDLPHILACTPAVRGYEVSGPKQEDGPRPYRLTPERMRHLSVEELEQKRRAAADEEAARYRAMYDALGFRVGDHPDGTLEVEWKFGKEPKLLRTENDASPNRTPPRTSRHGTPARPVPPARRGLDLVPRGRGDHGAPPLTAGRTPSYTTLKEND